MRSDRRRQTVRASLCLLLAASVLAACSEGRRDYPVSEQGRDLGSLSGAAGSAPPVAAGVTFDRILRARSEPQNWLTYYGAYDGQRYSSLDQIGTGNVRDLRPAWTFQFGEFGIQAGEATYSFEAAPIVVDGVMYATAWDGWAFALNAETGQELWRYKHEIPIDTPLCCGNVNRGVAVANGKVFVSTPNAHLVALDAVNGRPVWKQVFGDVRAGESATLAPVVVKNLVVGTSGAEFGILGHIDAYDLDTGRRVWRRYNVPKPGEPGGETWPEKGEARTRGAAPGSRPATTPSWTSCTGGRGTRRPTSTAACARGRTSTPPRWWPSTPTTALNVGTTSGPRMTCGTTTATTRTSSSTSTGASSWRTSTRTGTSSSWTAPTDSWSE